MQAAGERAGPRGGGGRGARQYSQRKRLQDRRAFQRRSWVGGAAVPGSRPLLPPFLPSLPGPWAGDPQAGTAGAGRPPAERRRAAPRAGSGPWRAPGPRPSARGRRRAGASAGSPAPLTSGWLPCAPPAPTRRNRAAGKATTWPRVSASCSAPCRCCCGAAWTPSWPRA